MARRAQYSPVRRELLGRSSLTTVSSTTATSNGSAHTKGSYATIGTTTFQYSGFYLAIFPNTFSVTYRFDVAINTGGSDVIIVQDFFIDGNPTVGACIWFPIAVPSGAAIKIRCQDSAGGNVLGCYLEGYMAGPNGPPSYSRVISLTGFTNTDATTGVTLNGTTQTAYGQVVASTAARVAALYIATSDRGDAARTTTIIGFDIARGAGGSEVIIFSGLSVNNGNTNFESNVFGGTSAPFWCDLPASTRLAVRAVANSACADTFGVCLMGLVP